MSSSRYKNSEHDALVGSDVSIDVSSSQTLSSPINHAKAGRFLYTNNVYRHTNAAVEAERILSGSAPSNSSKEEEMIYSSSSTRFSSWWASFKDKAFALLFFVNMAFFFRIAFTNGKNLILHGGFAQPFTDSTFNPSLIGLITFLLVAMGVSFLLSYALLEMYRRAPESTMWFSVLAFGVTVSVFTVAALSMGYISVISTMFSVASIVIVLFWWLLVRNRVPAAAKITEAALSAFYAHGTHLLLLFTFTTTMVGWVAFFAFAAAGILANHGLVSIGAFDTEQIVDTSLQVLIVPYLFFTFYWSTQFIRALFYCIVSGAMASYWLLPGYVHDAVVAGASNRALLYNFGSICMGSLIVAVVNTLRSCLRFFTKEDEQNLAQVCLNCLLGLLEEALRYFNSYAYVYMSIYGTDYMESGRRCCELFASSGIDVIAKDDVVAMPVFLGTTTVTLSVGTGILAITHGWGMVGSSVAIYAVLGMAVCACVCNIVFSVVESSAATAYVVWAELPAEMAEVQPEMFALIDKGHKEF